VSRLKKAAKKVPVIDPYLPHNGNFGYRVSRYELDLEYKVAINRLAGSATITAVTLAELQTFTLDLSNALTVTKVSVNGRRPAAFSCSSGKLRIALSSSLPAGAAMTVEVRYGGTPRPVRSLWGEVGFEELTEGVLVAGQPNGAASWFPCDDHPSSKASYHIQISTENPYRAIANGELKSRRTRAAMTTWTYELEEPTSTYLVTLQIGMYESYRLQKTPVPMHAALPARLKRNFDHDFGRQPQMMKLFVKRFGPYPLSTGYTVVVTDDELEIPLEAQGISIFGANHCDGSRDSERLIAHELAHQWFGNSVTARRWRDIWLHEGFAEFSDQLWAEHTGGETTAHYLAGLLASTNPDWYLPAPGNPGAPDEIFAGSVYDRGAATLAALRLKLGDHTFFQIMRGWLRLHRFGNATVEDFTAYAQHISPVPLAHFFREWLYAKGKPSL
jgi:aminopeptidase N